MCMTTILRCGALSRDKLVSDVYDICNDGVTTDDEILNAVDEIVDRVNSTLPGALYWEPYTSEIHANVEDDTAIDEDEFSEILDSAISAVLF